LLERKTISGPEVAKIIERAIQDEMAKFHQQRR
jgi:hypothetical protein